MTFVEALEQATVFVYFEELQSRF